MNIAEHLIQQAAARPEAAAIIDAHRGRRRVHTFAALEAATARAATLLARAGLRAGDAVLLLQPMSAELYAALGAIFRLGLVAVVLDPSAGRRFAAACCRRYPPDAFVGSTRAHALRLLLPEVRRIPRRFVIGSAVPGATPWRAAEALPPHREVAACSTDSPALLTFTSGSTGAPKAVVRTHGQLIAQYEALRACLRLEPGQVDLATLPIFVLANLAAGVTSVIPDADLRHPGRVAPEPILEQIRREAPTRTGASPAFFERLLEPGRTRPFGPIERLYTGGAPVFPDLLQRLRQAAPETEVVAVYGSTEAEPIAHLSCRDVGPAEVEAMRTGAGLLAGLPVDAIRVRILPDRWGVPLGPLSQAAFERLALPPGAPGEIVVQGPHVLPGYLGGEGDEETKIQVEGARWHRTGDAGYLDAAGRLWLLGRCAARIEDAHGVLYPFAVESAARALPGVRRAAALSVGGRRVLVLEAQPGHGRPRPEAVRVALAWARLDAVHSVRALPVDRRHNAKIDYPALHRLLDRSLRGKMRPALQPA